MIYSVKKAPEKREKRENETKGWMKERQTDLFSKLNFLILSVTQR